MGKKRYAKVRWHVYYLNKMGIVACQFYQALSANEAKRLAQKDGIWHIKKIER